MESDTYINEVDVRKIAVGQKVQITLDADPTKKLDGTVTAGRERRRAAAEPGFQGIRGQDRGREGRHDASPGHDDGQRDRDGIDSQRACPFRSRRC